MSDLISRKETIKAIDSLGEDSISYYKLLMLIVRLPSAEPERKWTPVTEALPEEDTEVLVTVRFDGTKNVKPSVYVETASQINGTWTSYSDEWKVSPNRHHVIAWIPLPEAWREE